MLEIFIYLYYQMFNFYQIEWRWWDSNSWLSSQQDFLRIVRDFIGKTINTTRLEMH
jgi:hypothetical protein